MRAKSQIHFRSNLVAISSLYVIYINENVCLCTQFLSYVSGPMLD